MFLFSASNIFLFRFKTERTTSVMFLDFLFLILVKSQRQSRETSLLFLKCISSFYSAFSEFELIAYHLFLCIPHVKYSLFLLLSNIEIWQSRNRNNKKKKNQQITFDFMLFERKICFVSSRTW